VVGLLATITMIFAACAEAPTESFSHRPGGISKYTDGTSELEGITATASPQCPWGYEGTPPDCIPDGGWVPVGSSPQASIGDMGSGGEDSGGGGSGVGAEDEGLAAFAICVAAKMGTSGWASVLATGISAWQLFEARQQVASTYGAWQLYHDGRPNNPNWDGAVENLFWANYKNAESAETALWTTTAAAAGTTVTEVGKSMLACAPTLAAPEP
jgi:hypothetical protein